jgi:hypothetical protein
VKLCFPLYFKEILPIEEVNKRNIDDIYYIGSSSVTTKGEGMQENNNYYKYNVIFLFKKIIIKIMIETAHSNISLVGKI